MRLLRIIFIAYFVLLAVLASFVLAAKPGPANQITQGVRLGDWQSERGTVYFSGKRLTCEPAPAGTIFDERCRIEISGQELVILATNVHRPNPTTLGACEATYAGNAYPCSMHSHHNWPGAPVAYLSGALDLSGEQLDVLRRRFPIENLPEVTVLRGALILWPATALALYVLALMFVRRRVSHIAWRVLIFVSWGGLALVGIPFALIMLTRGFWD